MSALDRLPPGVLGGIAVAVLALPVALLSAPANAQTADAGSPREAAPIDLTGQWVSVINEDWRWRMVTPPKGDYASVPLNDRGREVADRWEPSQEGSCAAYGAAGLLRMPTRVRIAWAGQDVLEIETDAGRQTRRLEFAGNPPEGRSLQGYSTAEWQYPQRAGRYVRFSSDADDAESGYSGTLKVVTSNLAPAWLRRNGVPYSDSATMTEYFSRFESSDGEQWFVVTTIVDDPVYLARQYVTSSHFRREAGRSGWNPRACRAED